MRELITINKLIEDNFKDSSLTKRCIEHFFRVTTSDMEEGIDEVRVPYLGKLEKRTNGARKIPRRS